MSKSDGSTADYYVLPEGATQLQDLISHRDMNSQIGEIFRACYRYGIVSHSDKMRDAKKIRFYAQAEVERLEKLAASEQCGQLEAKEEAEEVWKESPDSATHYIPDDEDHYAAFWRKDGDKFVECWIVDPTGGLTYSKNPTGYKPGNVQNIHTRPTSTAK